MKNLDDLLLQETKKVIGELSQIHPVISTINIIESLTGAPYKPNFATSNIGLSTFLSTHQKELGIQYLNTESITIDNKGIPTMIWKRL